MKFSQVDFDNVEQVTELGLLPLETEDPHSQENGVLANRWNITNTSALNDAERAVTKVILTSHSFFTKTHGQFDLAHLRLIHKTIFTDIYPWAGELRKVDVRKGDTLFCGVQLIEKSANIVFDELARKKHLKNLALEVFASEAGLLMSAVNMIHPFREGNGRTQRVFIQRLAFNAGYALDWMTVSEDAMRSASIAAEDGNPRLLQRLIQLNIKPITNVSKDDFAAL